MGYIFVNIKKKCLLFLFQMSKNYEPSANNRKLN